MSLLTTLTSSGNAFTELVSRPSLEVYFDAIDSPITKDGSGDISQWSDLSGNGNHALQVGSDPMPTYVADKDGYPAIYSNGDTGRKLDFTHSVTQNDPFTVIALFRGDAVTLDPTTGSSLNVVFAFGGADTSDNSVALRQDRTNAQNFSFVAYSKGSILDGNPYAAFESFAITYDQEDVSVHYGDTLEGGGGAAGATRVFGKGCLFNEQPSHSARTGIGWFRSLLLSKEALSDTDRNTIITAMKARYGLT
ncbi:MAG: hypothetical protein P8P30_05640 [Rickettsiales bacterium]|nr:hypothetical protein [Rickettsiales bacterium]